MSDQQGVDFDIGFNVNQSEVAKAKEALAGVGDAAKKTVDAAERTKTIDNLGKSFAQLVTQGNDAADAAARLKSQLDGLGATDQEIERVVRAFDKEVAAINRADEAAAKKAANDKARFDKEIEQAEIAARKEDAARTKRIEADEIAARKENTRRDDESRAKTGLERQDEVESASGKVGDVGDALAALGSATGIGALSDVGALFEGIEAVARVKAGFEALPESLSATAKAAGLMKTAQSAAAAAEGASAAASTAAAAAEAGQTTANTAVAGSSAAAAGGTLAFVAAMGPIAILGAVVAAAILLIVKGLEALSAQSAETNAAMTRAYEANRSVQEAIIEGATREDALEEVRKTTERIKNETDNLAKAKAENDRNFAEIQGQFGILGDIIARFAVLFGLDGFGATNAEIDTATKNLKENQATLKEWNDALANNETAYNDQKKAEEQAAKDAEKQAREKEQSDRKAEQEREKAAREAEAAAERIKQAQEAIVQADVKAAQKREDIARQSRQKLDDLDQSNQEA